MRVVLRVSGREGGSKGGREGLRKRRREGEKSSLGDADRRRRDLPCMWEVPIPVGKFGREGVFPNDSRRELLEETSE